MNVVNQGYYVYILASQRNGTFYIGFSNDIIRRIWEHKQKLIPGFTAKYSVHLLVWYEFYIDVAEARRREKQLKNWQRSWKLQLIEQKNSSWRDLYYELAA